MNHIIINFKNNVIKLTLVCVLLFFFMDTSTYAAILDPVATSEEGIQPQSFPAMDYDLFSNGKFSTELEFESTTNLEDNPILRTSPGGNPIGVPVQGREFLVFFLLALVYFISKAIKGKKQINRE